MSILPSILLLGVTALATLSTGGGAHTLPPPLTPSPVRICAVLCTAGLGGQSCNQPVLRAATATDSCLQRFAETRQRKTVQQQDDSTSSSQSVAVNPRRDACSAVLCPYGLGEPLCQCEEQEQEEEVVINNGTSGTVRGVRAQGSSSSGTVIKRDGRRDVDYRRICWYFCTSYGYRIDGCPPCARKEERKVNGGMVMEEEEVKVKEDRAKGEESLDRKDKDIDWNQWCRERCSEGDGGVACNCDILPFNLA